MFGGVARLQGSVDSGQISGLVNSGSIVSIRRPVKRQLNSSATELEPAIKQEKLDSGYEQAMINTTGTLLGTIVPTTSPNIPHSVTVLSTANSTSVTNNQASKRKGRPPKVGEARLNKTVNVGSVNSRNNRVLNRPVILLRQGAVAAPRQASVPAFLPRHPMVIPNAGQMSTLGMTSVSSSNAPVVVLVSRPSVSAARQTSTVMTPSSGFRHPIRLPSAPRPNNMQVGSSPLARLKSIIGRSVLDKYVGPHEPPSELHMPVRSKRICQSCGDEFVTDVGLVDHMSRRSMLLAFRCTCKLSKWPRLFYNPCMYDSFYRSHCVRPGLHVLRDSVVFSALDLDTAEYRSCLEARTHQKGTAAGEKEVRRSLENVDNQQHVTTADSNSNSQHVSSAASVKEIYVDVEIMQNGQRNEQLTSENVSKDIAAAVVKKTNKNHVVKPASAAKRGLLVKRGKRDSTGSKVAADSLLLTKVMNFSNALCHNRAKCQECSLDFKKRRSLSAHFTMKYREQMLRCTDCGLVLPNTCSFSAHLRLHKNKSPFVCPQCGIAFDKAESVEVFKAHVERLCFHLMQSSCNSRSTSNCPRCSFNMPEPDEAKMAQHFVDAHAAVYYKCRSCPKAFVNDSAAERHSENTGHDMHKDTVRKCPLCDAVFRAGFEIAMQSHMTEHLSALNTTSFECPVCPEHASRRSAVIEHVHSCHPGTVLPATTCEVCGQPLASQQELFMHVSTKHVDYFESVMKCLPCAVDNKSTSDVEGDSETQHELASNASTVSAEEPTPASESEVQTSTLSTQASDTSVVSSTVATPVCELEMECSTSPTEVFDCPRCQMKFTSKDMYKRHKAKHKFLELKKARKKQTDVKSSEDPLQQVFMLNLLIILYPTTKKPTDSLTTTVYFGTNV